MRVGEFLQVSIGVQKIQSSFTDFLFKMKKLVLHYFQTNSSVNDINTRYKNQLQIPSVRLSAIQRGITYSAIKIFNKLPPSISRLKKDKLVFAIRNYLLTHVFYSIEEFVSNY
jgi:hypothetical protein